MTQLTCFKAYDIRGKLGTELNEEIAYKIGRAYGQIYQPKTAAVGCDMRLSSEGLKQAVIRGLNDAGVNVLDLGMTGTEEVYFGAFHLDVQGGIEITASHNPMDYNGMKLVRENARPISADTGLKEIQALAESGNFIEAAQKGSTEKYNILPEFAEHLMGYIDPAKIRPLKLVMNAGNGAAGHVIDAIEEKFQALNIPVEFIKIHHEADGTFPNGIPNPILVENRASTRNAVLEHKADMGIAWDGDFDRCFFFDETGAFVEGYYLVGLLAQRSGQWDVFVGLIAIMHPDTRVLGVERQGGLVFITIDRMISMVHNIYAPTVLRLLAQWDERHADPETNTIDRYLQTQPQLRVVTTLPFLVGHHEELHSSLWGIQNSQYAEIIAKAQSELASALAQIAAISKLKKRGH